MSANTSDVNPFGEWNFVWLAYCDGTSQTSNRDQAVDAGNGKKLHFRGRALLDAHLYQLEQKYKFLSTATEVIMSGTSAGGMSTFVQSSFVKSQLQVAGAKLVAVPDAGWWWDHAQYGDASKHPWLDTMTGAIGPAVWNATLRGSMAACLKDAEAEAEGGRGSVLSAAGNAPAPASMAKCFTQPYAYSYMTDVPTFIVQSFADPANIGFCYKGPCSNFEKCSPSQLADVQNYGTEKRCGVCVFFCRCRNALRCAFRQPSVMFSLFFPFLFFPFLFFPFLFFPFLSLLPTTPRHATPVADTTTVPVTTTAYVYNQTTKQPGQELKQSILSAQTKFASRDSHFMTSCNQHEETCRVRESEKRIAIPLPEVRCDRYPSYKF